MAKWTFENGMGTIMLQAGELATSSRLAYLQELVARIVKETQAMDLERRGLDPNVSDGGMRSRVVERPLESGDSPGAACGVSSLQHRQQGCNHGVLLLIWPKCILALPCFSTISAVLNPLQSALHE